MPQPFDFQPRIRLIFGQQSFSRLGELAAELHFTRTLLVADQGMAACGYVARAIDLLAAHNISVFPFHAFSENPDTDRIEAGRAFAAARGIDSIIALGGGSSLDCAKGINFVLTGGGAMRDYWGHNKLSDRKGAGQMLQMIGVPTTSGTGSEAQTYALISDAETHAKMACGDDQAAFRLALLDPELTVTQPRRLTATSGFDAITHAVESFVTTRRNPLSDLYAREAWRLLAGHFEQVLDQPDNLETRAAMQLGAYFAGAAIEASMLGATHSCANPLTASYGTAHGDAVALMAPHIIRWNKSMVADRYHELLVIAGWEATNDPAEALARRLEQMAATAGLPGRLRDAGVAREDLEMLSEQAAKQWTGQFNPRAWSAGGALEVYQWAW
ncbi:MAG: iron-containing alcohol dehydrogenase [Blastocatellia bacterium]